MLFWICFVKEGSFILATLVWTTNLIVKKCFLPRPKSHQFNTLQVSRRFFISCLYSRYVEIYLLTWRRRHFFYKIPQALARSWPSHDATRACGGGSREACRGGYVQKPFHTKESQKSTKGGQTYSLLKRAQKEAKFVSLWRLRTHCWESLVQKGGGLPKFGQECWRGGGGGGGGGHMWFC
jgi:hypothetical protein